MSWIKGRRSRARSSVRGHRSRMERSSTHVEMNYRLMGTMSLLAEARARRHRLRRSGSASRSMRDGRGTRWLNDSARCAVRAGHAPARLQSPWR